MTFPVAYLSDSKSERPTHLNELDTEFANKQREDLPTTQVSSLYDARFTIEICGKNYTQYTVWAFADVLHGVEPISQLEDGSFFYGHSDETVHEDPISGGAHLDANMPIMDARLYAFQLLHYHIKTVVIHWRDAVELFDKPFEKHVRCHPLAFWSYFGARKTKLTSRSSVKTSLISYRLHRPHVAMAPKCVKQSSKTTCGFTWLVNWNTDCRKQSFPLLQRTFGIRSVVSPS